MFLLILATKELQLVNSSTLRSRPPHFLVGVLAHKPRVLANYSQTDVLGSAAFKPVKNDMLGNIRVRSIHCPDNYFYLIKKIKKVRERQLAAPLESTTLQMLVKSELATKKHTATEGLLWLVRGLDFCAQALRADISAGGSQELSTSFRDAYSNTLAPHHSWLVKPLFSAAMAATPYREEFIARVAGDRSNTSKAEENMKVWVAALEERIGILYPFLASEAKW